MLALPWLAILGALHVGRLACSHVPPTAANKARNMQPGSLWLTAEALLFVKIDFIPLPVLLLVLITNVGDCDSDWLVA